MGHKVKFHKGDISITNYKDRFRLRWRVNGDRYSLNLPYPYTDYNLPKASICAAQIKLDIIRGVFDPSLEKYRVHEPKAVKIPRQEENEDKIPIPESPPATPILIGELVEFFDLWATTIRNADLATSAKYANLRAILVNWGSHPIESLPSLLGGQKWAPATYNGRLGYYRIFLEHLAKKHKIATNPLDDINPRKNPKKVNQKREALTNEEILAFLDAIKTNKLVSKYSGVHHSHYYPFLNFIFSTGVRNSEAIGLRVKYVNLEARVVEITETLARTSKGTNHAARLRKGTKTENSRFLPLSEELMVELTPLVEGRDKEDLVFLSPKGVSIDDHMLQKRVFKPVMKALGLGDRDLYVARHSFGTRAVQQGMVITDVAYLMGHSTIETCMRNYVGVSKPSNQLPTINKG